MGTNSSKVTLEQLAYVSALQRKGHPLKSASKLINDSDLDLDNSSQPSFISSRKTSDGILEEEIEKPSIKDEVVEVQLNQSQETIQLNNLPELISLQTQIDEVNFSESQKSIFKAIMLKRWKTEVAKLPFVDQKEVIEAQIHEKLKPKSAEYSQTIFESMMAKEKKNQNRSKMAFVMKSVNRDFYASKIQWLCIQKNYKEETIHRAIYLMDRCIQSKALDINKDKMPLLYITCVIMGAKLEQPLSPSIKLTLKLIPELQKLQITKDKVIELEKDILHALDFNLDYDSPLVFLERFFTLLSVTDQAVINQARELCLKAKLSTTLSLNPASHIAAGSLIWAINLAQAVYSDPQVAFWNSKIVELSQLQVDTLKPILLCFEMTTIAELFWEHQKEAQRIYLNNNFINL